MSDTFEWCTVHDAPRGRRGSVCIRWTYPRGRQQPDHCVYVLVLKPVHPDLPVRQGTITAASGAAAFEVAAAWRRTDPVARNQVRLSSELDGTGLFDALNRLGLRTGSSVTE